MEKNIMNKIFTIFMLICLLLTYVRADEVKFIKKDEPAPYEGYLFSPEKEKEVRYTTKRLETVENLNQLQEEKVFLYEKRLEIRDKQLDALSNRVVDEKNDSFLSKAGMFILGALVTTGIVFGVQKVSR